MVGDHCLLQLGAEFPPRCYGNTKWEVPGSHCGISVNHLNLLYVLDSLKTNSFENSFEAQSDFTIMEPGLTLIFFFSAFSQPY